MHNHDDKYPSRPGFEPGTLRLQAPVDTNEPSGPALFIMSKRVIENCIIGQSMHVNLHAEKYLL